MKKKSWLRFWRNHISYRCRLDLQIFFNQKKNRDILYLFSRRNIMRRSGRNMHAQTTPYNCPSLHQRFGFDTQNSNKKWGPTLSFMFGEGYNVHFPCRILRYNEWLQCPYNSIRERIKRQWSLGEQLWFSLLFISGWVGRMADGLFISRGWTGKW